MRNIKKAQPMRWEQIIPALRTKTLWCVATHVSSVEKCDHYAFAWVFFTTQLTHDLFISILLLCCHANMCRLWRDLI